MLLAPPPIVPRLVAADAAVQAALRQWNGGGRVPRALATAVLHEQLLELKLADHPRLYRVVLPTLPRRLRQDVADDVTARRDLESLAPPKSVKGPRLRIGPALPALRLRSYYLEAQRRTGVAWQILAAINYVESDFGRLREPSWAGAQGPMQFIRSTWAQYGHGNVHDPHAAILAAARFLHAAGAPAHERAAVHHYNPSWRYVDAVEHDAARIRRDPRALLVLYSRQLLRRTKHGWALLTHVGLR